MMLQENEAVREGQHANKRKVPRSAEIRIAVFGPHPPIVGDGIFEAAARGPPGARVGEGCIGSRDAGEGTRVSMMVVLKPMKATPPVP
jgi:hypothetical protein